MNLQAALEQALKRFGQVPLEEIRRNSGFPCDDQGVIVEYFGRRVYVRHPGGEFQCEEGQELPLPIKILILHYLGRGQYMEEMNQLISYKELPGGMIYIDPFTKRAINPLLKAFGSDPERLQQAALKLGGSPLNMGDAAAVIRVFPHIPVTVVLWGADEEFSASGNILFDRSAPAFLETEDYAVLASALVGELIRAAS